MVYKNLILRIVFSILIFLFYIISLKSFILLFILGLTIYLIIFYEILKFFKNKLFLILLYFSISFLSYTMYFFYHYDYYLFNLLIYTIIIFDVFSYFVGYSLGKNYPFKNISPNKTIEGYIGGIFFTNLLIISYYLFIENNYFSNNIVLLNIIIISSLIGDLIQSWFKRINYIKNSSNFLPGHGGFFDRFDSFVFSIICLTFYSFIISWI